MKTKLGQKSYLTIAHHGAEIATGKKAMEMEVIPIDRAH